MPTVTPGAIVPAVPYPLPVPPPVGLGVSRVAVSFDAAWLPYVLGCCKVLTANSTFDPPDPAPAIAAIKAAYDLLDDLAAAVPFVAAPANPAGCDCDCEDCMQLRYNNCTLQQFDCVTQIWVNVPTVGTCVQNTQPGGGVTPPSAGACQDYQLQFPANALTVLPFLVNSGDTLTLNTLKGAGSDGSANWFCPDGSHFFGGACVGGQATASGDPLNTSPHMCVLLKIGSSYYPFFTTTPFTVPSGVTNAQIFIGVNDAPITDDSGIYSIDFNYCNNQSAPVGTWRAHINFAVNSGGFTAVPLSVGAAGNWSPGTGWTGSAGTASGGIYVHGVYMRLSLAAATVVNTVEIKGSKVDGGPGNNPANTCFLIENQLGTDLIPTKTFGTFPSSPFDMTGPGTTNVSQVNVLLWDTETPSPTTPGSVTITDLYLAGTGTIPPELAPFSY